jgi:hypothetical protein
MGYISDEWFRTLSWGYEQEQAALKDKIASMAGEIRSFSEKAKSVERFMKVSENTSIFRSSCLRSCGNSSTRS